MTHFVVRVEDPKTGIVADHYRQAVHPSTAREAEEALGYIVLGVRVWGPNESFPRLPDYVGRATL